MKRIKLTQGQFAIVDDADFEWLSQWKWYAEPPRKQKGAGSSCNIWYAVREKGIRMHREILGLKKGDGKQTDHRNGNGLDNKRVNLRICTRSENMQNLHHRNKKGAGKHQGVHKQGRRWRAVIVKDGKRIHIGTYDLAKEAARAYDRKALELYGPEAKTNYPKESYRD